MCGILGFYIKNAGASDFQLIRDLFKQSQVRGRHATGISFLTSKLETIIEPLPAEDFIEKHLSNAQIEKMINPDGGFYAIGHCRYSTSDLKYNQPIHNKFMSIVHNGVITQEPYELWEEKYKAKCVTRCDSELIIHSTNPLSDYKSMSVAAAELLPDKSLRFYRNGKRPLHYCLFEKGVIITSTKNILVRSSPALVSKMVEPMKYYTVNSEMKITKNKVLTADFQDLQCNS